MGLARVRDVNTAITDMRLNNFEDNRFFGANGEFGQKVVVQQLADLPGNLFTGLKEGAVKAGVEFAVSKVGLDGRINEDAVSETIIDILLGE
jgi:hypothetical protein